MSNGRRQPSCGGTSRMTRECQVRFCERLGVQFPGPTRHSCRVSRFCLLAHFCCTPKADLRLSLRQAAWVCDALVAPHWDAPLARACRSPHRRVGWVLRITR